MQRCCKGPGSCFKLCSYTSLYKYQSFRLENGNVFTQIESNCKFQIQAGFVLKYRIELKFVTCLTCCRFCCLLNLTEKVPCCTSFVEFNHSEIK